MRRLLIRPGAIGDFIVSLPALESLKADYTELWCPTAVASLADFADRTCSLAGSGLDRLGLLADADVVEKLREFQEIHSWYGTNRPDFRESARSLQLPFRFYDALPGNSPVHAVDFYLGQVKAAAGAIPRLRVLAREKENFAVLHPFSGSVRKNWPLARWRELEELLRPRMRIEWCHGPEENLPGAVAIANLRELAQWISSAHVFIGNDSGITHLAAATATATVAIFGPTDTAIWGPRGDHVTLIRGTPLEHLQAEAVAEAVR